jgi:SAM-dependent MidA family methyltransferase
MQVIDHTRNELPAPGAEAQAHSDRLREVIRAQIEAADGALPFDQFMQAALYTPGLGYYSAGLQKFGAAGDFVTAPEISALFPRCLARQCAEVMRPLGHADILECGAGSGIMAAEILAELEQLDCLPDAYFILELSAELRARQQATIKLHVPQLYARVHWLDALPQTGFRGVVLGNELLDAMPVKRFRIEHGEVSELCVGLEGERFVWRSCVASDVLRKAVELIEQGTGSRFVEGYVSEVNLAANAWLASISAMLDTGMVLLVDYGFPRHEFYHAQRSEGTLMCHYRHRAHSDPFRFVGLQDITAHVDFTAIAEAADDAGLVVHGFTTQAHFLLGLGVERLLAEAGDDEQRMKQAQQLKQLVLPSEMGELFKVIALVKGIRQFLSGFALQDHRGRL